MITVTGIVNQVLLAPSAVITGWARLTDPWLHIVTPALTLLVWLVWGPRGWISVRTVVASLAIPLAWILWMLARGAVIGAYPYPFANVAEHGYGSVLVTLTVVLVVALVIAAVLWGIDRALTARSGSRFLS